MGEQPDIKAFIAKLDSLDAITISQLVRIDQRERYKIGEEPPAESYLEAFPVLIDDPETTLDISYNEFLLRELRGESESLMHITRRFPNRADELFQQIRFHRAMLTSVDGLNVTQHVTGDDTSEFDHSLIDELPEIPGYDLIDVLASGGMATVYQARHRKLDRIVAIKLISGIFPSKDSRQRFNREALFIAALSHPNIVGVYDVGEIDGRPYLVLEFVDGGTIADHYRGRVIPPRDAAEAVKTLSLAIKHCHDHGVVHRDLKPSNVLLQSKGARFTIDSVSNMPPPITSWTLKLTDFGLSKQQDGPAEADTTRLGSILGTPSYMSPEQATGDSKQIGLETDIYSLGAILYEMLTGRPPFQGHTTMDVVRQVMRDEPISPKKLSRGLPTSIETICLKCLHKQPSKRYASAGELADDLQRYLSNQPIIAKPASIAERTIAWFCAHPVAGSIIASIAVAFIAGCVALRLHANQLSEVRASELVASLNTSETSRVMTIVEMLDRNPNSASRSLVEATIQPAGSTSWFHQEFAKVYFAMVEPAELIASCHAASPAEIELVRRLPTGFDRETTSHIWESVTTKQLNLSSRLRLAAMIVQSDSSDPRWDEVAKELVGGLVREPIIDVHQWSSLLEPIRQSLKGPLESIVASPNATTDEKAFATSVLAEHFSSSFLYLATMAIDGDIEHYATFQRGIPLQDADVTAFLHEVCESPLDSNPPVGETQSSPALLTHLAKSLRRARRRTLAAITLAHQGDDQPLSDLLVETSEPTARTYAIEWMEPAKVPVTWLLDRLDEDSHPSILSGCFLALGKYKIASFGEHLRSRIIEIVDRNRATNRDPGVRSAIAWLSRQWDFDVDHGSISLVSIEKSEPRTANRSWINSAGQTFVRVDIKVAKIGSVDWEEEREPDEDLRSVSIRHPFAIAVNEVTVEDIHKFRADFPTNIRYCPRPNCPSGNITFFDAAAYCRWLSEKEGIAEDQMCFPQIREIKPGMRLPSDYLDRTGNRIPTEDEWEFGCRAGSNGSWNFGLDVSMIDHYACAQGPMTRATDDVGSHKPNAWGLFDMHGNVREWCINHYHPTAENRRLNAAMLIVDAQSTRLTKGGSFSDTPLSMRSARINSEPPTVQYAIIGLRCVRTLVGNSPTQ